MKLLVFAHTPPPHHGQSYMVHLMIDGFGGDCRRRRRGGTSAPTNHANCHGIECYHVNARLSKGLEEIGDIRPAKLLLLLRYCVEAIWVRFRHGATHLYYVPAPGKYSALYRDWVVMLLCRPFFKKIILHWHAAGLARWLETAVQIRTRALTYQAMKAADLSIVLSKHNRRDAEKVLSKQIEIVVYGIPDPCALFERDILPRRRARLAARSKLLSRQSLSETDLNDTGGDPQMFKVLFVAHCTRDKGLFDTLDGVELANQQLAQSDSPIRIELTIAGTFIHAQEEAEFRERLARGLLGQTRVTYAGFVSGDAKHRVFAESDCFCFPTYYYAESFGLVVAEAMAFGLTIVTSRWRSMPEILPADYPGLVQPRSPHEIAEVLLALMGRETAPQLREHFLHHYTLERYLANLATVIRTVEENRSSACAETDSRSCAIAPEAL